MTEPVPTSHEPELLRRLIGGDPAAADSVVAALATTTDPELLVAGAVLTGDTALLVRARNAAQTLRDRQLVALADALLEGSPDVFDALVRDHLVSFPDHLLAAWLATQPR